MYFLWHLSVFTAFAVAAMSVQGSEFIRIGKLRNDLTLAVPRGLSADGETVLGHDNSGSSWLWTKADGFVSLPLDGNALVAGHLSVTGFKRPNPVQPAVWSRDAGLERLPLLSGHASGVVHSASGDGRTMVGRSCNEAFECSATLWLPMDTTWSVTPIKVNSLKSIATSISTDGETIIVQSQSPTLETTSYYVQSGKAPVDLGQVYATDMSADGSVVTGVTVSLDGNDVEPFLWTASAGVKRIGLLPGYTSHNHAFGNAISEDGEVVVDRPIERRRRSPSDHEPICAHSCGTRDSACGSWSRY